MPIGRPVTTRISGEDVLFKQYGPSTMRGTSLTDYLEGCRVSEDWVKAVASRVSRHQPKKLYRLCIVDDGTFVGTLVIIDKKIVSASDRRKNALYAGCSYHHDQATDLRNKVLALIQLDNPLICIAFRELLMAAKKSCYSANQRIENEREFIVKGPVKGNVIEIFSTSMITEKVFRRILLSS